MKKILASCLALLCAFSLSVTAFAGTWENVADEETLHSAFADEDTAGVVIHLASDIRLANALEALVGQTYVINGSSYVLSNVCIYGGGEDGSVTINGDVAGVESSALYTEDEVTVTVNGNVDSTGGYDGVDACGDSTVTVNGNITAAGEGVEVWDNAKVTVIGDVTSTDYGCGVEAEDNASVKVKGNVTGSSGDPDDVDMTNPSDYSDGDSGICASDDATVEVIGNVAGGEAYGTYGYAGDGVYVYGNARVYVDGNVTGGNVTGDPATELYDDDNAEAGCGINMSSTATVVVTGDVTGGSANTDEGYAGYGLYIDIVFEASGEPVDPEPTYSPVPTYIPMMYSPLGTPNGTAASQEPGSVTVGGTVSAGTGEREVPSVYFDLDGDEPDDSAIIPTVSVWKVAGGEDHSVTYGSDDDDAAAQILSALTLYTVKLTQSRNGTVSANVSEAQAGETVIINAAPDAGCVLQKVLLNGKELTAKDGVYSFVMPENGGVEVSAQFASLSVPKTGDTSNLMLWGAAAAAALGITAVLLKKRKA